MSLISRAALLGSLVLASAGVACDKVPLLAPTNTTIRLTSAVGVLPTTGSAEIVAVVIESAGTPVQNGTVISFTSSLGTVEPREARTQNGQVTVRFVAGEQSGTARINAFSGGSRSENLDILVGAAAAGGVTLRTSRSTVPATGGTVAITAAVVDQGGNALRNVLVNFATDIGTLNPGSAVTNANGEATTELSTNATSKVSVTVGTGTSAPKAEVTITATNLPFVTIATVGGPATNTGEVGVPTVFSLTPTTGTGVGAIRSAIIDFGDGNQRTLGPLTGVTTTSYQYPRTGFYTVTVTATDGAGLVGTSSIVVRINARYNIPLTITQGLASGATQFTANATPREGSTIRTYEWDFGDGEPLVVTTGPIVAHRYDALGTYRLRLIVFATNGDEGYTEIDVRVTGLGVTISPVPPRP